MPMPLPKKIGNRYYLQRRVPNDLLSEYPGKMIKHALHTSDLREAKARLILALADLEREFAAKRKTLSGAFDEIDREEAQRLATAWLGDLVDEDWGWRASGPSQASQQMMEIGTDETLSRMREALGTSDQSPVQADIAAVLLHNGLSVRPGSHSWRQLGHALLEANVRLMKLVQDRFNGKVISTPSPASKPLSKSTPASNSGQTQGITLAELIQRYMADTARDRSQKTIDGYRIIFAVLSEIIGDDTPVRAVSRAGCEQVRDLLRRLPPNASKRFKGIPLGKAADRADALGLPKLSPGTVNSYLNNLAALFKYAEANWHCDRSPAEGLQVADKRRAKDKRHSFDREQLAAIFSAPLYTGCQDDRTGYAKRGPNVLRRGRFWVPLLSLYTGMRLNECCQLLTGDVRNLDGVWCIIITEDGDTGDVEDQKRVKTAAGERYVPVHPELMKLGFLAYVSTQQKAGTLRLFHDLPKGKTGYSSDPFSKWFSRFLVSVGAKTDKTSFHSFRHTFRDAMREADLSPEYVNALGGWAGSKTSDNYGSGLKPQTLATAIAKLNHPGIDLSHLYTGLTN